MQTTVETETYKIMRRSGDDVEFVQVRGEKGSFGRRIRLTPLQKGGLSKPLRDLFNTDKLPMRLLTSRGWERKITKNGRVRYTKVKQAKEKVQEQPEPEPERIQQFTIQLFTEAPERQTNMGAGGIMIGDRIFTEYLPQGQSLTATGNVNLLQRLPQTEWQTVRDDNGIQLTDDLIDIMRRMDAFIAKRLENTRSKWGETNTYVRIGGFRDTPNVGATQPVDFRRLLVREDPEVGHIPSIVCKYMGYHVSDRISPYASDYMTHNHQPLLCWLSCILDAFNVNVGYFRKKRMNGFLRVISSYKTLLHEIFDDHYSLEELKVRGICWEDVRPFFEKYSIKVFLLDVKLQVRDQYIPDKVNSNIRPSALYFMVHNNHVYRLNSNLDEIEKTVLSRQVVLMQDKERPSKHIHLPTKEDKKTDYVVIKMEDGWVKKAFSYVVQAIQDKENKKKVEYPTTVFVPQNMLQELPYYIFQKLNVECRVMLKDFGTIDSVCIYNTTFTCIDNHICGSIEFKGSDMNRLEYFFKVFNETKCKFMNREWMSVYHRTVFQMLTTYKPIAISTGTGHRHSSITKWDLRKCYSSIAMNHLEYLPVFNGMDTFSNYDGGDLENWTMYLVQRKDSTMSYPYYRNSVCFGYNLKAYGSEVQILGMMRPSHIVKSNLGEVLMKVFENGKLDESEFSKNPAKWIANTCIGLLNRDRVSKTKGSIYSSLEEASRFMEERKGQLRIISNEENDQRLYLHIENGCHDLRSGFLPIAHFIVDTGNRLIMELKKDLEVCGFRVSNILTDCCNTEQDEVKEAIFRERFGEKWLGDGFGKITVEYKTRKSPDQKVRNMENPLFVPKLEEVKVEELRVGNEWDLSEIHNLFDKHSRVGVEAIMPGSGKTFCAKKYGMKSLFVVPTNKIRANLLKDGLDAITVCSLLGGELKREDIITDYTLKRKFNIGGVEKNIDDYNCLVFDEMLLNNIDTIYRIKRFLDDHGNDFKVIMNYDPFQNRAVGERLDAVKDVRRYKLKIVREMCGHYLILKEMKRNTNPENTKHYLALKSMLDRNDKRGMLQYVLDNCKVVGRIEDIETNINISYRNVVREKISNHVYQMIHGNKPWSEGQVLVYKGKSDVIKGVKGVFFKNVEYTVLETGDVYKMEDAFGDIFEVPKAHVKRYWVLPYCWTGHAFQGDTIDQPFTIDVNDLYLIDCEWLWTAITRTTDWSHIHIYYNRMIQKNNEQILRRTIDDMIQRHVRNDFDSGRFIRDVNEYIDTDHVMGILNTSCAFCGDPYEVGGCTGSFSIDRVDNNLAHTKDNCRIICFMCNSIKR